MPTAQIYCTVDEVLKTMDRPGYNSVDQVLSWVKAASQFISRATGIWLPITDTKELDGQGVAIIRVSTKHPILSVTSLTYDGDALTEGTDWILYGSEPRQPHWEDGPFSRIKKLSGTWKVEETVIDVVGQWGMYSATTPISVDAITLAATGTAILAVSDGSKLSPGMIILVEDEQIQVDAGNTTTTAATSLINGALTSSDEVITVDDASEFNVGEIIQIDVEDIYIRRINTTTKVLAVTRGYDQTLKAAHVDDSAIGVYRTFNLTRAVNGTTAAIHTAKAVARQIPPEDVKNLAIQMASLSMKLAETQFSGREGNQATGETFYFNQYPKAAIEAIKKNYKIQGMGV